MVGYRYAIAAFAFTVLAAASGGGNGLKSGPQVGDKIPGAFEPTNVTGKWAGEKHCLT